MAIFHREIGSGNYTSIKKLKKLMRDFTTLVLYITVRKVVVPASTTGPGLRVLSEACSASREVTKVVLVTWDLLLQY